MNIRLSYFLISNVILQILLTILIAPMAILAIRTDLRGFDLVFFFLYMFFEIALVHLALYWALRWFPSPWPIRMAAVFEVIWIYLHAISFTLLGLLGLHLDNPVAAGLLNLKDGNFGVSLPLWSILTGLGVLATLVFMQWQLAMRTSTWNWIGSFQTKRNKIRVSGLFALSALFIGFSGAQADRGSTPYKSLLGATWITSKLTNPIVANLKPTFCHFHLRNFLNVLMW